MKPNIRRCPVPGTDRHMWGAFITPTSGYPFAVAAELKSLIAALAKREEKRHARNKH